MQNPFTEIKPCIFNPMTASELSDEARKAVKAAFDAISNWRSGHRLRIDALMSRMDRIVEVNAGENGEYVRLEEGH